MRLPDSFKGGRLMAMYCAGWCVAICCVLIALYFPALLVVNGPARTLDGMRLFVADMVDHLHDTWRDFA